MVDRQAIEKVKQEYIKKLLHVGVYKHTDHQLYELSLLELSREYRRIKNEDPSEDNDSGVKA